MQRILANPIVQNVGKLIGKAAVSLLDQPTETILQSRGACSVPEKGRGTFEISPKLTASKGFVEWDAAIVKANRNEDYAELDVYGQRLSESLEDLNCFHMLACAEVRQSYAYDHPMFSMLDPNVDGVPARLGKMMPITNLPALGVVELLDRKSAEGVARVLQGLNLDSTALKLTDGERNRLKLLRNSSFGPNRTEEQMITFCDLEILA
ncbi:MAG: hypothetical protein LBF25_02205 [Puniceicoccales bacterium]|jgi:hypothetical protein|nr:hypothetical protein [Puniceicoccales bacterium]